MLDASSSGKEETKNSFNYLKFGRVKLAPADWSKALILIGFFSSLSESAQLWAPLLRLLLSQQLLQAYRKQIGKGKKRVDWCPFEWQLPCPGQPMVPLWHSWISRRRRIPWDLSSAPFLQKLQGSFSQYLTFHLLPFGSFFFLNQRYSLPEASFRCNRCVKDIIIHSFLIRQLRKVEKVKYYSSFTGKEREMTNNDPLIWPFPLVDTPPPPPCQHPQRRSSARFQSKS